MVDSEQGLLEHIHALNATVWGNRVTGVIVEEWLKGFGSTCVANTPGRRHALYLLSKFMFFGDDEIRAMVQALFRDHFKYPIVSIARRSASDTRDEGILNALFNFALARTRFLGMGNPSESGPHLLYHYRQENGLPKNIFISPHQIFDLQQNSPTLAEPLITRYVFIDDFCGSGQQAARYSAQLVKNMHDAAKRAGITIQVEYHVLIGTHKGIDRVKSFGTFDRIECVLELDESYRAFGGGSRYFQNSPASISKSTAESLASYFGAALDPNAPLGFDDGQLMIGFFHNTPDNTLPIFWHPGHSQMAWQPVFRRYPKF